VKPYYFLVLVFDFFLTYFFKRSNSFQYFEVKKMEAFNIIELKKLKAFNILRFIFLYNYLLKI